MSVLDREALAASPLADLHALASELSIDGYRRLRKAELIDAILTRQTGDAAPEESAPGPEEPAVASEEAAAEPAEDEERPAGRRRRGRRGGRGRGAKAEEEGA